MNKSLRSKTMLTIVCLTILAFVVGILLCLTLTNRYYVNVKTEEMLKIYDSISSAFDLTYQNSKNRSEALTRSSEISSQLEEMCEADGISVFIMDPSGEEIFVNGNPAALRSRLNKLTLNPHKNDNSMTIAETGDYIIQTVSDPESGKLSYIEMYGFFPSGNSFLARAAFSGITNSMSSAMWFFFFICVVVLIIAAVICYILVHSYSKPLHQLIGATKKASELDFGDIDYDSKAIKRKDEIGLLGVNIYEMAQKLEKTVSELKSSNLMLKNELKAKAELEEQRKKYISDVSHELKTPIALISGYAEGLKEGIGGSKEDQDYYVDVIIDEAEKMNMMVKRISALNKLEQGHGDVSLERFNVVEVINGYLNTMALIFEEKNVDIYFNNKNVIYVWSDEFLFEEILMNYINNALNHVDDNKIIRINVEPAEKSVRVTVFNTGNHIPDEDIARIWDEFYKVDKARTRAYGGSGLGLSIVKAIADTLEQEYGVYNTENGVAFWINLELDKVQEYNNTELEKHAIRKLTDLPIWQTTTKLVRDTSERMEAAAKEREEKDARKKEEQAKQREEQARHKEEQARLKEAKKLEKIEKEAHDKELKKLEKEARDKEVKKSEKEAKKPEK